MRIMLLLRFMNKYFTLSHSCYLRIHDNIHIIYVLSLHVLILASLFFCLFLSAISVCLHAVGRSDTKIPNRTTLPHCVTV